MKQFLSDRINAMEASATLAMAAKTRELKAEGKDIIGLSLGEPDFNIPDFIKEAAKEAIDQNYSKYTPVDGYLELREAIAAKLLRDNGLSYRPNQIVVSTGAKQCLANAALAMLNPGDEVIFPAPYWVSYKEIAKLAGATPVEILATIENDFKITPAQLEGAITEKTKMVWFNSPCNPTGSVYNQQELEALAKVLKGSPELAEMHFTIILGKLNQDLAQLFSDFPNVETLAFVSQKEIGRLYLQSDIAITRAGTTSLAEQELFDMKLLMIPIPRTHDQLDNAKRYVEYKN